MPILLSDCTIPTALCLSHTLFMVVPQELLRNMISWDTEGCRGRDGEAGKWLSSSVILLELSGLGDPEAAPGFGRLWARCPSEVPSTKCVALSCE